MTLSSIDQALNVLLTGILYGSSVWLACAFSLYTVTRKRRKRAAQTMLLAPAAELPVAETFEESDSPAKEALLVDEQEPCIEIVIEQSLPISSKAEAQPVKPVIEATTAIKTVETTVIAAETIPELETIETEAVKPAQPTVLQLSKQPPTKKSSAKKAPAKKHAVKKESLKKPDILTATTVSSSTEIVCEPVNWKKWKVADLRKASIAKICGVRTRPIGSRRHLPKADLIAQYEQQLKRLTQTPKKVTKSTEVA
ncbi:MAG: hypothetical protein AAF528_10375 [Cyanobacteria bacterium P01_C01_bin.121]